MKILKKWLYKIAMPTIASAMVAPVVVSCSVEKPKVETQEEKEKRLEHQRAMEIAPNLTKFLKKHEWRGYDNYNKDYIYIKDIKQLKELTSNINHLNDFEKSYLGLYEDIQNFFDNSIHKYTKDNISFEYLDDKKNNEEDKFYPTIIKLEQDSIKAEQTFFHKMSLIIKEYFQNKEQGGDFYFEKNPKTGEWEYTKQNEKATRETSEGIRYLENSLLPIIKQKVAEFSKKHKDFQFKNPKFTFKRADSQTTSIIIIQVTLEVEYQNQKLPKDFISIALTFNLKVQNPLFATEEDLNKKERHNIWEEYKEKRQNVKTFAEIENILNSKPNKKNKKELEELKENYQIFLDNNKEDKEVEM